jgi:hypothetical protein
MKDYYHLLNVSSSATPAQIEEAYKKFRDNLLRYYPAQGVDSDAIVKNQFPDVVEAHRVLMDVSSRAAYDLEWKKVFGIAEITPINIPKKEGVVLIRFNPDNRKRKNLGVFLFVFGLLGIAATVFFKSMTSHLEDMDITNDFYTRLVFLFVISCICLFYGKITSIFLKRFKKIRNLERVNNSFILHLRNGQTETVKAITFYKYFVVDFLYVNFYTESGKTFSIYMPVFSSYKGEYSLYDITNHALACKVIVKNKIFLFLNTFFEVPPQMNKVDSTYPNNKFNFLRIVFGILLIPCMVLSFYFPFMVIFEHFTFNERMDLSATEVLELMAIFLNPLLLQILTSLNNIFA